MTTEQEIAATILQQLGARRFMVMTGARQFLTLSAVDEQLGGLSFMLPSNGRNSGRTVNKFLVKLMADDTYTLEAWYVRGGKAMLLESSSDVYCDVLQETFTRMTGLVTHL